MTIEEALQPAVREILVRDRVRHIPHPRFTPEMFRRAERTELTGLLCSKLVEEAEELLRDNNAGEMGDVREVLLAIGDQFRFDPERVYAFQRGKFNAPYDDLRSELVKRAKLFEENKEIEGYADLLELAEAICRKSPVFTDSHVEEVRMQKREVRGGYSEGWVLTFPPDVIST